MIQSSARVERGARRRRPRRRSLATATPRRSALRRAGWRRRCRSTGSWTRTGPLPPCRRSSWRMRPGCSSEAGSSRRALEVREAGQHPGRQRTVEGQRHPRRQQGVAAEERHEPRRPGRDHGPFRVILVDDAQGSQVGDRLIERGRDPRRQATPPAARRSPVRQIADSHRSGELRGRFQVGGHAGRHGLHGYRHPRLGSSVHSEAPGARPAVMSASSGGGSRKTRVESVSSAASARSTWRIRSRPRQGPRCRTGAGFDVEHMREVGSEFELDRHGDRLGVRVPEGQLLDQAADAAICVGSAARRRFLVLPAGGDAAHDHRGQWRRRPGREQLD